MNKTICTLPYMHSLILPNGDINLCCNAEVSNDMPSVNDGYDNILDNPRHNRIREQLKNGEKPVECNRCWVQERLGDKSYRQQQNIANLKYVPKALIDGNPTVKFLDVRFNNVCNLKCVMCSSGYSTSWVEDEKKLSSMITTPLVNNLVNSRIDSYNKDQFKWGKRNNIVDTIVNTAHTLDRLHFAGGEPLLAKEHTELLHKLIDTGNASKMYLSYNTNGEYINDEMLSMWSKFKKVKVFYSLDAFGSKNDYIRYPSVWKEHEDRLDYIDSNTPKNMSWRLLTSINVLNINYVPEFADWKLSKNYKNIHNSFLDGDLFHSSMVEYPSILNPNVLPIDIKNTVKDNLIKFSNNKNYQKIANTCINYMMNWDQSHLLPDLESYLHGLDSIRGTNFKETFDIFNSVFA